MPHHPYESLPTEQYWRKAVAGVPPFALDPLPPGTFRLSRSERVATAGSCFAQHVSRALQGAGFNFMAAEADADAFSARYGNVYTTRQLAQLFDRAFGRYRPTIAAWRRDDGRYVDPFRPRAVPDGFASPEEVETARETHLARVREMFLTLDTFVFTLGLTEGWRHTEDGAALPVPPGVAGGEFDPARYEFVNAGVAEMTQDVLGFLDALREVNRGARLVLTVSPVALVATYEARHVLVSNTLSKAALRVVADEVERARPDVHYFPSYEIITAPANLGRYLGDDLRSVNEAGVAHVMRCFFRHAEGGPAPVTAAPLDVRREGDRVSAVVCDEELLDA
jgi:hypothetical protein